MATSLVEQKGRGTKRLFEKVEDLEEYLSGATTVKEVQLRLAKLPEPFNNINIERYSKVGPSQTRELDPPALSDTIKSLFCEPFEIVVPEKCTSLPQADQKLYQELLEKEELVTKELQLANNLLAQLVLQKRTPSDPVVKRLQYTSNEREHENENDSG